MLHLGLSVVLVVLLLPFTRGDTPANCSYEDIRGTWLFHVGSGGHDNTIDCSGELEEKSLVTVTLSYPDVAKDDKGNTGFWTMIYNQGFEVVIDNRKYFAFSSFTKINMTSAVSHCHSTSNGWSHNVDESDWACYYGEKSSTISPKITSFVKEHDLDRMYIKNTKFIDKINEQSTLWKAAHYPELEGMTLRDRLRRAGGVPQHGQSHFPKVAPVNHKTRLFTTSLPESMDWRNADGANYVTPIRNQGACGSCFAFASMAMLESRLMILTNSSMKKVFSPQDVVSCSEYAQGCEGGFPYLIAGKYAEDFGVVEEECFPYLGRDSECREKRNCMRYRSTKYKYVGGYFGACNEEEMLMDLVNNGPVSVAFEVTEDFQHYVSGIYKETGLTDKFNPWQLTNHAVLVVGYGVENGVKYWIVKNSWGESWGENGFFRIIRGTNELSIESMAVSAMPVLPKNRGY